MKSCPICSHQNPDTARFCVKCGWQLTQVGSKVTAGLSTPPDVKADADDNAIESVSPDAPLATSPLQHDAGTQEFSAQDFLVLVVDDTVDNLVIISLHLQQTGFRVVTATNGEEAVKVASLTNPDLILMDLSMPELDGLGATRKIREHPTLRAMPIVAVTAFSTEGFQRAAFDAGIDGYITKPIDFERMNDLIRSLLPVKRNDETSTMNDE
jgi:CheY-like chemotaxis protein